MEVTKIFRIMVDEESLDHINMFNDRALRILGQEDAKIKSEEIDLNELRDEILSEIDHFNFPIVTNESYPAGWWLQSFGKYVTRLFNERKQKLINRVNGLFRLERNKNITKKY